MVTDPSAVCVRCRDQQSFAGAASTATHQRMTDRDRYLEVTTETLPSQATAEWPVQADHCFQRIVLDNLFGDVWYDHLERPAHKNLTRTQHAEAVALAESMCDDPDRVQTLNQRSLSYRSQSTDGRTSATQQTLDAF